MMRKFLLLAAAGGAVMLTGCNSEQSYGIAQDRWASMTPEQHQIVEKEYARTQTALTTEPQETHAHPKQIRVAVYGGRALMPPFHWYQPYDKEVVDLTEGTCQDCMLTRPDGEKEVKLTMCYRNHELEIDPSKFVYEKRHGTVAFHESPIWKRGFTYKHVKTSGYARLKNAHIYVKQLS